MDCMCDRCGNEFDLEVREDRVEDVCVRWFRCPACGAVYIPYAEDRGLKRDRRRYQNAQAGLLRQMTAGKLDAAAYEKKLEALRAQKEDLRQRALGLCELVRGAVEEIAHGTV